MFDFHSLVRSHIKEMPEYEPILPIEVLSEDLKIPVDKIIKLDANENPYGALPEVTEALLKLSQIHVYPDPESRFLRRDLSQYLRIPVDSLFVGAGIDELIDLLMRLMLEPGDFILNCPPTFGMYAFDAGVNGARVVSIPRKPDFSLDLPAIQHAVAAYKPKMLFLASPNNPDGGLIPLDAQKQLLKMPILIVLDEAYIEFAPSDSSLLGEFFNYENLVILRTFSKWAGLAGLRVGYGVFPLILIDSLWKIKQPYNVSVAASIAAQISLSHFGALQKRGELIVKERARLYDKLAQIPWIEPYPSQANFVLCKIYDRDARDIKQRLAHEGIFVRYFDKPGLKDHLRISVGKPEHTDLLLSKLKKME